MYVARDHYFAPDLFNLKFYHAFFGGVKSPQKHVMKSNYLTFNNYNFLKLSFCRFFTKATSTLAPLLTETKFKRTSWNKLFDSIYIYYESIQN